MSVLYDVPGPRARRISLILSIVGGVAIVAGLTALVIFLAAPRVNAGGVAQPGMLDPSRWDIVLDRAFWRVILAGLTATLQMAGIAAVLAVAIGMLLSMARAARSGVIRIPATILIEFFRGMPVLLMMLFVLLVFSTGQLWAGVAALALYNGAVIGEALRSGIASLPKGQRESGLPTTFGSRYLFTAFFVVLAVYLTVNLLLSWIARIVARRTASGRGGLRARRVARVVAQLGGAGVSTAAPDPDKRE
jgi:glutamate transport system permease protein